MSANVFLARQDTIVQRMALCCTHYLVQLRFSALLVATLHVHVGQDFTVQLQQRTKLFALPIHIALQHLLSRPNVQSALIASTRFVSRILVQIVPWDQQPLDCVLWGLEIDTMA